MGTNRSSVSGACRWALPIALLLLALTPGIAWVGAETDERTIAIGESNDSDQRAALLDLFEATDGDRILTVTVDDTKRAMEGIFDLSGVDSAYSSTALTCRTPGTGLEVGTRNIELVPPDLYAMALLTGGVQDATLMVAAPDDAPALGMTALSGVFASREQAPCTGVVDVDEERQRLALEQLALTVAIGQELENPDGVTRATELVLGAQQAIIAQGVSNKAAIDVVVAEQEAAADLRIPDGQRSELVDLLTRLAEREMNWGAYASGWSIERDLEGNRVTLIGSGPVDEPLPVASPPAGVGAMIAPLPTQPAGDSRAAGAMAPAPDPAPAPMVVVGRVVGRERDQLLVAESGRAGEPVAYPVNAGTGLVRNGASAAVAEMRTGDTVSVMVDSTTGQVVRIRAQGIAEDAGQSLAWLRWVALLGLPLLALLAFLVFARRPSEASLEPVPSLSGTTPLDDRAVLQAVGLVPSERRRATSHGAPAAEDNAPAQQAQRRIPGAALFAAGRGRIRSGITSFRVMRYRSRQRRREARSGAFSR